MTERILVISNTIDAGGAESFVMRVFRCLHRDFIFDFLINKKESNFYLQEIHDLNGKVYYGVPKSKNPIESFVSIYRIVKREQYKKILCIAVHPVGWLDLLAARIGGARICLTRATVATSGGTLSALLASLSRPIICALSTKMLAPSKEAARWLFGRRITDSGQVQIIHNGLQSDIYRFDSVKRKMIRESLGLNEQDFVLGHVGRFALQKNHEKVLGVFCEVNKRNTNSKLLLIGDGELLPSIKKKVKIMGVEKSVRFLGIRNDVPELLMAMDCFVFPSFYEGMPNAVIEAQATGLPCAVSSMVSDGVKLTDSICFFDINEGDDVWAEWCLAQKKNDRSEAVERIIQHEYDIDSVKNKVFRLLKEE